MHLLTRYNFCFFLLFLQMIDGIYLFLPPPQIFCHNQINICTYNNDSIFCRCKLGYFKWRLLRANGQHYSLIWRILLTCWWPNTHACTKHTTKGIAVVRWSARSGFMGTIISSKKLWLQSIQCQIDLLVFYNWQLI